MLWQSDREAMACVRHDAPDDSPTAGAKNYRDVGYFLRACNGQISRPSRRGSTGFLLPLKPCKWQFVACVSIVRAAQRYGLTLRGNGRSRFQRKSKASMFPMPILKAGHRKIPA